MATKPTSASGPKRRLDIRVKPAPKAKTKPELRKTAKPALRAKPRGKAKSRERRNLNRRRLLWLGRLKYGEFAFECRVFDLSLGGAKVELDLPLKRGTLVTLQIPEVGIMIANVAWARDGQMALAFSEGTAAIRKKLAAKASKLGLL
ncbi:MAG: PilZ domain-containing protein [Proteobacteria bacterium]|nr:PilZ domain-containing protein [Pseudomonadota bacterium]